MWLDNLKELKARSGMSSQDIANVTNLPIRTVTRIFSGDTENPSIDTLHRITSALGGSLDEILADTNAVVGSKTLYKAEEEIKALTDERDALKASCAVFEAENANLKTSVELLVSERNALAAEIAVVKDKYQSVHEQLDTTRDMLIKAQIDIIRAQNYYIEQKISK